MSLLRSVLAGSLLLATGCIEVEERLAWSPDGARAILRVEDKLYFMDTNGVLSAVIASNVTGAAWLPDGRGLVLTRSLIVDKWTDAETLLPADEILACQTLAGSLLALSADRSDQFELKRPELASAAILYLFDTQSNALHEAVQKSKDPGELETELSNLRTSRVSEVSVVALDGTTLRVIERTLAALDQPRPSPKLPQVAFTRGDTLIVAPLDGATNRVFLTDRAMGAYDWTPDGNALVHPIRQSDRDADGFRLVDIKHSVILQTNDTPIAGGSTLLTVNACTFTPRVRCLPDGRVLFAGISLELPGLVADESKARFYIVSGTNAAPVAIATPAGALPQDLGAFVPSPDGRQIAIVESGSDSVVVLNVADGKVDIVSPNRGWKSRILPAWRGDDELYFAALPATSTNRPELFRWRRGSAPQAVSTNWSDTVVKSLLRKPEK